MCSDVEVEGPNRLIRFCGADCEQCETYQLFLVGDTSGLVNPETEYRCCWLPDDHPGGRVCPIAACCRRSGLMFCAECDRFDRCELVQVFYAQPGYERLRERMLEATSDRKNRSEGQAFGRDAS